MERAWCPLSVLGAAVTTARCGAFDDDLEVYRGWAVNPDGTDTAPADAVRAGEPGRHHQPRSEAARHHAVRLEGVRDRRRGRFVIDRERPRRPDERSARRPIALPADERPAPDLRLRLRPQRGVHLGRFLRAIVERADGSQVEVFRVSGRPADVDGAWRTASISMDAFAGQTVHLRFVATDGGPGNLRRGRARRHPGDAAGVSVTASSSSLPIVGA